MKSTLQVADYNSAYPSCVFNYTITGYLVKLHLTSYLNHAPEMIDFTTLIFGGGTARVPQVRYNYKLAPTTQLFVSAEEGNSKCHQSGVTTNRVL